jgi:hypothetical protein
VEVQWTCQYSGSSWYLVFTPVSMSGGPNGQSLGNTCKSTRTSGEHTLLATIGSGGPTWQVGASCTFGSCGSWTATVSLWY